MAHSTTETPAENVQAKDQFSIGHQLNGQKDYNVWATMILDTLELYELAKPVYDSTGCLQSVTFEDKNIKTKLYITRNLSVERKKDIQNLKLPSLISKYFHTAYAGESFSRMYKGVMDLIRFDPGRSTSMRDSLSLLTQNVRATEEAAASKTISIEHLGLIMFQSRLPTEYAATVSYLNRSKIQTIEGAQIELVRQESLLETYEAVEPTALNTTTRRKTGHDNGKLKTKQKVWQKGTILCKDHQWCWFLVSLLILHQSFYICSQDAIMMLSGCYHDGIRMFVMMVFHNLQHSHSASVVSLSNTPLRSLQR